MHIFICNKTTDNFAKNLANEGGPEWFSAGGPEFEATPLETVAAEGNNCHEIKTSQVLNINILSATVSQ